MVGIAQLRPHYPSIDVAIWAFRRVPGKSTPVCSNAQRHTPAQVSEDATHDVQADGLVSRRIVPGGRYRCARTDVDLNPVVRFLSEIGSKSRGPQRRHQHRASGRDKKARNLVLHVPEVLGNWSNLSPCEADELIGFARPMQAGFPTGSRSVEHVDVQPRARGLLELTGFNTD